VQVHKGDKGQGTGDNGKGLQRLQLVGLTIAFASFFLLLLLPINLPTSQHRLLAVLGLTFTCWVTEALPLPVTALLAMLLCVVLGILPAKQAFAPLGNPVIFLFLGAFLLAESVRTHELDRRIVEWLLSRERIARTPLRILAGFAVAAWSVSGWMSNTATTATLYPLAWQTFQRLRSGLTCPESFGLALLLICAYASSIGGIITPIGTPPNLIGLGFLAEQGNVHIGFLQWMLAAMPIGALMLVCLLIIAWLRVRKGLEVRDLGAVLATQVGNAADERGTQHPHRFRDSHQFVAAFWISVTVFRKTLALSHACTHPIRRWSSSGVLQRTSRSSSSLARSRHAFRSACGRRETDFELERCPAD